MARTGRPPKYKKEFAVKAEALCRRGATVPMLAEVFDVSDRTIERWAVSHDEFCRALKVGREEADSKVARSLYERALGYEVVETDVRVVNGEIVQTPVVKQYPPDTTAAIFWLKNRAPDDWRDKKDVAHSADDALAQILLSSRRSDGKNLIADRPDEG